MTRQRSSRAIRVRGGRWWRPPRPKPQQPIQVASDNDSELGEDPGYESCGAGDKGMLASALMCEAASVIDLLQRQGEGEAAEVVQALCDHLNLRERAHSVLKRKFIRAKAKLECARARVEGQENLQGQCNRYWWQVQRLQRKLFSAKHAQCQAALRQPP